MNSSEIQNSIFEWACNRGFTAPYGVLMGEHTNKNGKKYKSVTFGRARTLDATVSIYNRNFITVRTNRHDTKVFKTPSEAMEFLETL